MAVSRILVAVGLWLCAGNAFDQMQYDWGTPRGELDKLPAETRALLRSTVLLFTEAGDGYGGLLYQPPPTPADKPHRPSWRIRLIPEQDPALRAGLQLEWAAFE